MDTPDVPLYVLEVKGIYCVSQILICLQNPKSILNDQDFSTGSRLIKESLNGLLYLSVEGMEIGHVVLGFSDAELLILPGID